MVQATLGTSNLVLAVLMPCGLQPQGEEIKKLQKGDITDFLIKLVAPKFSISAPTFFSDAPSVITSTRKPHLQISSQSCHLAAILNKNSLQEHTPAVEP
jgi:4-diphosphocytidyl-2C-methyl-D-erythritol kinase